MSRGDQIPIVPRPTWYQKYEEKNEKKFWTVPKPDHPEIKLPIGTTSCSLPQIKESNSEWNSNQNWGRVSQAICKSPQINVRGSKKYQKSQKKK